MWSSVRLSSLFEWQVAGSGKEAGVNQMQVLHIVPRVGRDSFGLGTVVLGIARAQVEQGDNVEIWCTDDPTEIEWATQVGRLEYGIFQSFSVVGPKFLRYSPAMELAASTQNHKRWDVVHQHGIWTGISRVTNRIRQFFSVPTVLTPHGSLDEWAVNKSQWKKRLALIAYEQANLRRASCLHALAEAEANSFRRFGIVNPIAVIPNGVSDDWLNHAPNPLRFRERYGIELSTPIMLFLGRITPKKGLPLLLNAMSQLGSTLKNWMLIIAGTDEYGHLREVQTLVDKLALQEHVKYVGPLYGDEKHQAFAAANLFVLPSYSEGSPMTVLEALGAGLPVLTTRSSPWGELITHRCGWWCEADLFEVQKTMSEALTTDLEELGAMGKRGRILVSEKYSWRSIAHKYSALYKWVAGEGDRPKFTKLMS
jgi:glycosyltransferase involved in cell wall biosynthesis